MILAPTGEKNTAPPNSDPISNDFLLKILASSGNLLLHFGPYSSAKFSVCSFPSLCTQPASSLTSPPPSHLPIFIHHIVSNLRKGSCLIHHYYLHHVWGKILDQTSSVAKLLVSLILLSTIPKPHCYQSYTSERTNLILISSLLKT